MYEIFSFLLLPFKFTVKLPSRSVTPPLPATPTSMTDAPMIGSPVLSVTTPFTVCADTLVTTNISAPAKAIFFFLKLPDIHFRFR